MKPWQVGLLVFVATVVIGVGIIVTRLPSPPPVQSVPVVAVPVAPPQVAAVPAPVKRVRHRVKSTQPHGFKPSFHVDLGGLGAPGGTGYPTGGIFSGVDPNDSRIYH